MGNNTKKNKTLKVDKTCEWCYKPTNMPSVFASQIPILDWVEDKINLWCAENGYTRDQVWGESASWDEIEIPEELEMELMVYDELIFTIKKKVICSECLSDDDKMWKKYYLNDLDKDDTIDWSIEDIN